MDGQAPPRDAVDTQQPGGLMMASSESETTTFDVQVVRKMLESAFSDPATQVEPMAVQMSAEVMRMFVEEAVHRAGTLAQDEARRAHQPGQGGEDAGTAPPVEIQSEHFLKILPQLLLDFS